MSDYTEEDLRLAREWLEERFPIYDDVARSQERAKALAAFRAEARQSEREACERIVEEEATTVHKVPECRTCGWPRSSGEHDAKCPFGKVLRRLRERAK